jgi:hypothetical protein
MPTPPYREDIDSSNKLGLWAIVEFVEFFVFRGRDFASKSPKMLLGIAGFGTGEFSS